ncbi:DUF6520 family protein [Flavobacterium artemisiae]|uniref:DUF6520 family protein n=1 Tax=Flavobacterium artemisiae TaxID=2126556 RepID=A0ABW4HJ81_9FLAO|nr:DUF6520 family protein [Flavobacterium sp. GSB-24]BDU26326.1 hypothetical protein FLGSB24_30700 [Flavobacterium sp. GSB-24]
MKTIVKKAVPMAIFVLGISGAFFTSSMQSAEKADDIILGYRDTPQNPCSMPITCSDQENEVCRVSYLPAGEQVFAKDEQSQTTCSEVVYRP